MKRALIIQHMNFDHPGRFLDWFAEDGILPHPVRMFEGQEIPSLADYDLMFVLGGAQDTWQESDYPYLAAEKAAIREWVWDRAKPYFGVCLGHQLLATALGGEVALADKGEIGVFDATLRVEEGGFFAGLNPQQRVLQWHFAEVKRLPQSAEALGSSENCAVQALAIDGHALSTQFHCEASPQTILTWGSIPSALSEMECKLGPGSYSQFVAHSMPEMPEMARSTKLIWDNFKKKSGLKT